MEDLSTGLNSMGSIICRNDDAVIGVFGYRPVESITLFLTITKIKDTAVSRGMKTLWDSALAKVASGITSLEEVYAVTFRERE
jgi:hypothetical protein